MIASEKSKIQNPKSKIKRRRGVLLLVVLSLLVLFMMIGTAFVITAKQAEKGAKASQRAALKASDVAAHADLLDEVLMQLVRDTNNPSSSLHYHSLLEDMYGVDGWVSQIPPGETKLSVLLAPLTVADTTLETPTYTVRWPDNGLLPTDPNYRPNVTGGQMLEFDLVKFNNLYEEQHEPHTSATPPYPHTASEFSPLDDAYAGQVLTFTSGPARGQSTRIVGSLNRGNWLTLRVMAFKLADGSQLPANADYLQQLFAGARILVNGRPFNGTGAGFNPTHPATYTGPRSNMLEVGAGPLALLPNTAFVGAASGNGYPMENIRDEYFLTSTELTGLQNLYGGDPAKYASVKASVKGLIGWNGRGGADESYDAPDFQNMALALIPSVDGDRDNPITPPRTTPLESRLVDTVLPNITDPLPSPDALERDLPLGTPQFHGVMVLPSFHRPELVKYWKPTNPAMLRKVMLRPSWFDHPNFTGSNPDAAPLNAAFNQALIDADGDLTAQAVIDASADLVKRMIYGPWDVDNDTDGIRDSVWIDFGAPVMIGPEGKLVRPLAAIMCVDMDGRVNVNVAGSLDMAAEAGNDDWTISPFGREPNFLRVADDRTSNPQGISTEGLPRGMGASPADITPATVLGDRYFRRLLVGDNGLGFPGRYGLDNRPGWSGFDLMGQVDKFDWPDRVDQPSNFASPMDVNSRYTLGINQFGQPVYEANEVSVANGAMATASLRRDAPGELDVAQDGIRGMVSTAADMPFSLAELERSLRMYDADALAMPSRLLQLANLLSDPENRLRITTDSYDLPVPNIELPANMRTMVVLDGRLPQSAAELLETRVRYVLQKKNNDIDKYPSFPAKFTDPAAAQEVRNAVRQLLAPELSSGLRLNVNRPLGNGRDDNANKVVDEPGEELVSALPAQQRMVWKQQTPDVQAAAMPADFANAPFIPLDADDDGRITDADSWMQRQLLARHLYVMALTSAAGDKFGLSEAQGGKPEDDRKLARNLAQWAINAVDFRDPDNIMTPFEYDVNPFDGWAVDGWINAKKPNIDGATGKIIDFNGVNSTDNSQPYRGVVWGAERPEMLITETIAWHDRRTEDHADEEVDQGEGDGQQESGTTEEEDPAKKDGSYDQLRRPRGAFFVEIYNPWPENPGANGDTHDVFSTQGRDMGVNLRAVAPNPSAPNDPTQGSPVWRLAIYKAVEQQGQNQSPRALQKMFVDPDDPDANPNPGAGARPDPDHPVAEIDRSVYFTGFGPAYGNADGATYYNNVPTGLQGPAAGQSPALRSVRPGRYLVIGSGDDPEGDGVYESALGDPNPKGREFADAAEMRRFMRDNQRRVELEPSQVAGGRFPFRMVKGASAANPEAKVPNDPDPIDNRAWMCDVAVIDRALNERTQLPDATPNGKTRPRRLTISEPPQGYPADMRAFGGGAVWKESDDPVRGDPEGKYVNNETEQPEPIDIPLDDNPNIQPDGPLTPGFHPNFKQVSLQRLANPLLMWNPDPQRDPTHYKADLPVNPYMTVDSSNVNLTVFNGRNRGEVPTGGGPGATAIDNPEDGAVPGARPNYQETAFFGSLERGWDYRDDFKQNRLDQANLWQPEDGGKRAVVSADIQREPRRYKDNDQFFKMIPVFTMGYINKSFDFGAGAFNADPLYRIPNSPDSDAAQAADPSQADPQPFPWLTWNNRPFVSGNELMVVPQWRSSQMLRQFSTRVDSKLKVQLGYSKESESPYKTAVGPKDEKQPGQQQPQQPAGNQREPDPEFAHLENFFYSAPAASPPAGVPSGLYRLLDLVQTPSLFTGTQTRLNPAQFGNQVTRVTSAADPRFNRQPPFNTFSEYREPGRINLNTIPGRDVWNALFHFPQDDRDSTKRDGAELDGNDLPYVYSGPDDDQLFAARRGYGNGKDRDPALTLDANFPSMFSTPFRSPNAGDLVPLDNMRRAGFECTLLRSTKSNPANVDDIGDDPLFSTGDDEAYNDNRRNPYFRFQPMIRLSNLVTTRSNVYAVWVTIGFFEVEEIQDGNLVLKNFGTGAGALDDARKDPLFARVYPDGYTLGQEAGADTGDVHRLRGFYIIDRSIPAGFEPGKNINVENTIRLRRQIE